VTESGVLQLGAALLLDRCIGDPRGLPHPVRWIGAAALHLEPLCTAALGRTRLAGALFCAAIVAGSAALGAAALALAGALWPPLQTALAIDLLYACLAARDLDRHASAVLRALRAGSLPRARRRLSRIVGRDTAALEEREVVRGAVESVAESSLDGCVSPLFYAALGGPLAALAFKAASTLDSMVGHLTPRYAQFGWASARLDDALGYLPARLLRWLAPLAAAASALDARGAWRSTWRDGGRSPSPNAGIPEAALAGALGVQLGGVNHYGGVAEARPLLGEPSRPLEREDVARAVRWMYALTALAFALFAGVRAGALLLLGGAP
jgi:adenosylcobinamide-phosphate synthase